MTWAAGIFMAALAVGAVPDKTSPSFILGGQIADAARVAEKVTDKTGDALQATVTTAAQKVITVSGEKPMVVQNALETVLSECTGDKREQTAGSRGYVCPTTGEAYIAIEKLLIVVRRLASLELAPGAGFGDGIGALGAPPLGGGGADYTPNP